MKTSRAILAILPMIMIAVLSQARAKRLPPPVVEPVVHQGVKYVAPNESGERGIVRAHDVKTGRLLWVKNAFTVTVKPELERDVQWTFIKSMSVKDNALVVIDERGRSHRIDLEKPDDKGPVARLSRAQGLKKVREIAIACHLFATDNEGKLPASLKDLAGYLKKGTDLSQFELVTGGIKISEVEDPVTTLLVQTRTAWNGKRVAAFLDGHSELVPANEGGKDDK